ncbi:hypothetical protein DPSP01_010941 [Paraphaeosphaeria sporulosa]
MLNAKKATRVTPHVRSPTAVPPSRAVQASALPARSLSPKPSTQCPRSFRNLTVEQIGAEKHYYLTEDGRRILDASGGAAVSCFGPGPNDRIADAVNRAYRQFGGYSCSLSFTNGSTRAFVDALVESTGGHMEAALLYGSGSDACEAAAKLLLQYHAENNQAQRRVFIAREQSYHGTTAFALSWGSYWARREPFQDVLMTVPRVAACNSYRGKKADETVQEYVARLVKELEQKFRDVGPEKIAGFVCEPVVGAALGCMPAVPGYLQAVRELCDKHDVPLVFDEIMCGWGRTGTLHTWQHYGVVPDIQLLGKGLVGGYEILSAMLVGKKLGAMEAIRKGSGTFNHGHTIQGMPKTCAGALETLKMVQELLPNIKEMGDRLMKGLQTRLGAHRHVGDIRGMGLFIAIEFVQDRLLKAPFNPDDRISKAIQEMGLTTHNIHVYPGTGSANPEGREGDHIIIAPPYDVDADEIDLIVNVVGNLIENFFEEFKPTTQKS